jgi:hemolysin activation/secretion protein
MKQPHPPFSAGLFPIRSILAWAALACLGAAKAQGLGPSVGDISRQVEPSRGSVVPAAQPLDASKPQPSAVAPGATTVQVRQWVVEGNTLLTQAQVDSLLLNFTVAPISLTQINEAAAAVQRAYEAEGWLARVVLPEQDVTEGIVRIQVVEARLGSVVLDTQGSTRVKPEVVQAIVSAPLTSEGALNTHRVNRGLLLADDLGGVGVSGQLKSGQLDGTTDVWVRALDEPAWMFEASLDNGNARSVGEWRAIGSALWLSPMGHGETFSAQVLKSEGAEYLRVGASAPLGSSGLKGNLAASRMNYRVVEPEEDGVVPDIRGSAQTFVADLAYPLIRSRAQNLYVVVGVEQRDYDSDLNAERDSRYRVLSYAIGLSGNHFDTWGGAGANVYSLSVVQGRVTDRNPSFPKDPEVLGHYDKVRWALSRQQALTQGLTLYASVQGQHTGSKRLDSSENMSLGGPSAVRAYPVGEASGPQGSVTQIELRWTLSPQWLITPFYDHGRVQKRNADELRAYSLKGAGVSVTWTGPDGWVAKATYARRMGRNPNPTDNGNDQDGSLRKDRLWVSLNRSF